MSMPVQLAADLTLNVRGVNKAQNDIEKSVGGAATRGLSKAIKSTQKLVKSEYSKAYEDALRIGHKEDAALLKARWKVNTGYIKTANAQVKVLNQAIAKEQDKDAKKRLKAQRNGIESNLKLEQAGMRAMVSERAAAQADQLKLLDEGMERAARSFGKKTEGAAESFTDIVNKGLTLDSLDPADLMKSMAGGLKNAAPDLMSGGKSMMSRGAKMGGGMGKMMAMAGKAAMSLGALAGAIAGVVAVVAIFAVVAAAAYGKTKAWNKAIMEGVSGFDAFNASAGGVGQTLDHIRKAASRVSRAWSTAGEEVIATLNAFHQSGLAISEMKAFSGAAREVSAYAQVMTFAQVQTRALGIESGELAQLTNRMYEQYGFGLSEMTEQMAHFGGAAQMAGMNTRSFVAAVMEASANMALYNFRLEDTSELLIGLTKILGEDLAKQTLGMEGTFRNMGTEGRYKASMTGGKALGGVIDAGATRQLEGAFSDMTREQLQIMRDAGIIGRDAGREFGADGKPLPIDISEIDLKKLGGLSGVESGAIMNQLSAAGAGITGFEGLTDLAAGIGGNTLQRADALDELDRPGEIAATVAQAMGVLDFKDFESMGAGGQIAMENMTGLQGEQLRVVETIFNRVGAQMQADDPSAYGASGPGYAEIAAAISGGTGLLTEEMQQQLADMEAPAIDVATQQLQELQTIGDVLGTQIAGLLNWIGGGVTNLVDGFLGWFGGGSSAEDEAVSDAAVREKELIDMMTAEQAAIREIERGTGTDAEKDSAIAQREARIDLYDQERVAQAGFQSDIASGSSLDDAGENRLMELVGGEDELNNALTQAAFSSNADGRRSDDIYSNAIDEDSVFAQTIGAGDTQSFARGSDDMADVLDQLGGQDWTMMTDLLAEQRLSNAAIQESNAAIAENAPEAVIAAEEARDEAAAAHGDAVRAGTGQQAALETLNRTQEALLQSQRTQEAASDWNLMKDVISANGGDVGAATRASGRGGAEWTAVADQMGASGNRLAAARIRARQSGDWSGVNAIMSADNFGAQGGGGPRQGAPVRDFVYQGDSMGGLITPIDDQDSFFGAKPGGALSKMGGRSIVISNLTINESGDPQKTLRMVKQALRAAQQS